MTPCRRVSIEAAAQRAMKAGLVRHMRSVRSQLSGEMCRMVTSSPPGRVVHQHIHATIVINRLVNGLFGEIQICEVSRDNERSPSERFDRMSDVIQGATVARDQRYIMAPPSKLDRRGLADAARCPGDNGHALLAHVPAPEGAAISTTTARQSPCKTREKVRSNTIMPFCLL